jgi:hypothetical protein
MDKENVGTRVVAQYMLSMHKTLVQSFLKGGRKDRRREGKGKGREGTVVYIHNDILFRSE